MPAEVEVRTRVLGSAGKTVDDAMIARMACQQRQRVGMGITTITGIAFAHMDHHWKLVPLCEIKLGFELGNLHQRCIQPVMILDANFAKCDESALGQQSIEFRQQFWKLCARFVAGVRIQASGSR